jgi:hypothetical protein
MRDPVPAPTAPPPNVRVAVLVFIPELEQPATNSAATMIKIAIFFIACLPPLKPPAGITWYTAA